MYFDEKVARMRPDRKYYFQIVIVSLLIILALSIWKVKLFTSITNAGKSPDMIATWGGTRWSGGAGGRALDISIDDNGNIYVLGSYNDTVDFDPGAGIARVECELNSLHMSKLDSDGNLQWTQGWNNLETIWDEIYKIAVIPGSGVVIVGTFIGNIDLEPGDWSVVGHSDEESVNIIVLNDRGEFQWVRTWEAGSQPGLKSICDVVADESGNIYIIGNFQGQCDFGDSNEAQITSKARDGFLVKYRSDGNLEWVQVLGGSGDDRIMGLALDQQRGWVYAGGHLDLTTSGRSGIRPGLSSMTFKPGEMRGYLEEENEYSFFSKFDMNGVALWTDLWEGGGGGNGVLSIALDKSGKIYTLSNTFCSDPDVDPGAGVQREQCRGDAGSVLSRFNVDGELELASWWGCQARLMRRPVKILADESENVYILADLTRFKDDRTSACAEYRIGVLSPDGSQAEILQLEGYKCSSLALDPSGRILIIGNRAGYMTPSRGVSRIIQLPQDLLDIVLVRLDR